MVNQKQKGELSKMKNQKVLLLSYTFWDYIFSRMFYSTIISRAMLVVGSGSLTLPFLAFPLICMGLVFHNHRPPIPLVWTGINLALTWYKINKYMLASLLSPKLAYTGLAPASNTYLGSCTICFGIRTAIVSYIDFIALLGLTTPVFFF